MRRDTDKRQPAPKTQAAIADPVFGTDGERVRGIVASPELPVGAQQLLRAAEDAGVELHRLPLTQKEASGILALVPDSEEKQAFGFQANRATATSPEMAQYRQSAFRHARLRQQREA